MLRNYLIMAVRLLVRHKLYSAINILGLSVGLASFVIITLYVQDQLSYDRWIPDHDRLYRIETSYDAPGRGVLRFATSPVPVLPGLVAQFPGIESAVRLLQAHPTIRLGDQLRDETVVYTDPEFFSVFDVPFVRGDRRTALADPHGIVLSQSMAERWFGGEDPLGRVLTITRAGRTADLRVTGVLRDLPSNSHLRIDFLARLDLTRWDNTPPFALWADAAVFTYFKLRPGVPISVVQSGMAEFARRNLPEVTLAGSLVKLAEVVSFDFTNVCDVHLHSTVDSQFKPVGNARMVYTIAVIAALILLVSSINFMNLTTAVGSLRAREISLRKVVGASRGQLVTQFLGESVLAAELALLLGLALVELGLPSANAFFGTSLTTEADPFLLPKGIGLAALVGVGGGLYPALYLSAYRPAMAPTSRGSGDSGASGLRSALVPLQFAVMIVLLVCTAAVYAQTSYSRSLELGFRRDRLLIVSGLERADVRDRSATLAELVRGLPGVAGAVRASHVPGDDRSVIAIVAVPGQTTGPSNTMDRTAVDDGFFELMGVPILAGRSLSAALAGDEVPQGDDAGLRGVNVVINDLARQRLGFPSAAAALGQSVRLELWRPIDATIVGVAADYRFLSSREPLQPAVFLRDPGGFSRLVVRYSGDGPAVLGGVEAIWRRLLPDAPFRADYVENIIADQYELDETQGRIFGAFAALAVVVACLGLLGMASFAAERRVREIGIRRVLGASSTQIVTLLLGNYSRPVLLANLVAWPVAYWIARDWLNQYSERIQLSPLFFLGAGALALLIAWATVVGYAISAARRSPVQALRYD